MSNLTAAVGNVHISELDQFLEKRNNIANFYTENLNNNYEKILPEGESGWYKYILYLPKDVNKKEFKEKCKKKGLGLPGGVYDQPIHLQPVMEKKSKNLHFPVAEEVCNRHICLPIYPNLTNDEMKQTVKILNEIL